MKRASDGILAQIPAAIYCTDELAGLPGMAATEAGVRQWAKGHRYPSIVGFDALPQETRDFLLCEAEWKAEDAVAGILAEGDVA
jgi:hypothetical protein